jgi:hypothetical protein
VAGGAIVVKVVSNVVRVGHALEISLMAGIAVSRGAGVARRMTRNARGGRMRAGEGE